MTDDPSQERGIYSRRTVLKSIGGAASAPFGLAAAYHTDRAYPDRDEDGIPDGLKESDEFHDRLEELFGSEQFDGLATGRTDFLIDARYVGDASVPDSVKRALERVFRDHGIHMQWLDYGTRYEAAQFEKEYGYDVRRTLWADDSFYRREVEDDLKDVAFQLLIVPGKPDQPHQGRVYSPWSDHVIDEWFDGWVNGMNVGNRAIIGDRSSPREQARLALHEIAHLALCHDDDPDNQGVMGTGEAVNLTGSEWRRFRENLDNVHDTTGFDVAFRRCLLTEQGSRLCHGCSRS